MSRKHELLLLFGLSIALTLIGYAICASLLLYELNAIKRLLGGATIYAIIRAKVSIILYIKTVT